MSAVSGSRPRILLFRATDVPFDHGVIETLGADLREVSTANDLQLELASARPLAVIVVVSCSSLVAFLPWLRDIERRNFFSGMRFAILVVAEPGQSLPLALATAHRDLDGFRLVRALLHRDLAGVSSDLSGDAGSRLAKRLGFCLGLSDVSPFSNGFDLSVRADLRATVMLPGRLSWVEGDSLLCVEASARIHEGATCQLRFETITGVVSIAAQSAGSDLSNLRFNFGNATKFVVSRSEMGRLKAILAREDRVHVSLGNGFRRALVVVRNADLRERIASLLHANQVEMRTPLVWRNITTDIPRQNPHVVIIEDSLLSRAKVGSGELVKHVFGLCSPGTLVVVVGAEADVYKSLDSRLILISDLHRLEEALLVRLAELPPQGGKVGAHRSWYSGDAMTAHCVLAVAETLSFVSNEGVEFHSHHNYRPLANILVNIDGVALNFIGKCVQTMVVTPYGRGNRRGDTVVRVVRLDASKGVEEVFSHALVRALQDLPGLLADVQSQPLPQLLAHLSERPLVVGNKDVVHVAQEVSPKQTRKRTRKTVGRTYHPAIWVVFGLIFALIIAAIIFVDNTNDPGRSGGPFSESFEKLFERYDRGKNKKP